MKGVPRYNLSNHAKGMSPESVHYDAAAEPL